MNNHNKLNIKQWAPDDRPREENKITKMNAREAIVALLQGNYRSGITNVSSQKTIDVLEKLCSTVSVYKFDCLPDRTAVECLKKELKI